MTSRFNHQDLTRNACMLRGSLASQGYDWWWHSFTATNTVTGERKTFFLLSPSCNGNCPEYLEEICTARFRVPYVCNGCETIGKCTLLKNIYDAEHVHIKSHETITRSRSGMCVSEEKIRRLNCIISPLIQNGQSVNQVYINHADELMCSEKNLQLH